MSWFSFRELLGLQRKDALSLPSYVVGQTYGEYGQGAAFGLADASPRAMIEEGYKKNSAVFACVATLGFAFPEPPLTVFRKSAPDEDIPDHPIRQLLDRPNPDMGEAELWQYVITYMAIGGNAYLYKERSAGRKVVALRPYHHAEMWPVAGGKNWADHYAYDPGDGNVQHIPKEDVIHCKWMPDPHAPGRGFAPLKAVAREIDSDNELTRYLFSLLKNDAMPRTALRLPESAHLSEEQYRRLREQFVMRYGGDRRGNVAVLEGGIEIERLALNLDELAFDALRGVPEARIAAAFRVPAIIAGLSIGLARSTYSNYGEARQSFAEQTLVPLWRNVASEISQALLAEYPTQDAVVRFDIRKVEALTESRNDLWTRVLAAKDKGVLNINEARSALGYDPLAANDPLLNPPPPVALAANQPPANQQPAKEQPA